MHITYVDQLSYEDSHFPSLREEILELLLLVYHCHLSEMWACHSCPLHLSAFTSVPDDLVLGALLLVSYDRSGLVILSDFEFACSADIIQKQVEYLQLYQSSRLLQPIIVELVFVLWSFEHSLLLRSLSSSLL